MLGLEGVHLPTDSIAGNLIVAAILVPIIWYLIRDLRHAIDSMRVGLADLTLAIALDVASRPDANPETRRVARRIAESSGARDSDRVGRAEPGD